MRLYEFAEDPQRVKLSAIVSQLRARMRDTGAKKPFSVKSLLDILAKQGLHFDREQLESMITQEPLVNLIANLEGDNVIFKGQPSSGSTAEQPDASTDTLEKMAKRAEKRRD